MDCFLSSGIKHFNGCCMHVVVSWLLSCCGDFTSSVLSHTVTWLSRQRKSTNGNGLEHGTCSLIQTRDILCSSTHTRLPHLWTGDFREFENKKKNMQHRAPARETSRRLVVWECLCKLHVQNQTSVMWFNVLLCRWNLQVRLFTWSLLSSTLWCYL